MVLREVHGQDSVDLHGNMKGRILEKVVLREVHDQDNVHLPGNMKGRISEKVVLREVCGQDNVYLHGNMKGWDFREGGLERGVSLIITVRATPDSCSSLLIIPLTCCVGQTRLTDWQEGGLVGEYFYQCLREVDAMLKKYESSAVPSGWTCQWDRYGAFYLSFFSSAPAASPAIICFLSSAVGLQASTVTSCVYGPLNHPLLIFDPG